MQWVVKQIDVTQIKYAKIGGKLYKVEIEKNMRKFPVAENQA